MGNGAMDGGRARHERPGSGRPPVLQPQVANSGRTPVGEPEAPKPREAEAPAAVAPSVPSAPAVSPATIAAQCFEGRGRTPARRRTPARDAWLSRDDLPSWRRHLSPHGRLGRQRKPGSRRRREETAAVASSSAVRALPLPRRLRPLRLPPQPPRLRWNPPASRRPGRAARRRVASGPRYRPGTKSCSVVHASETSPHRAPAFSLPMAFTAPLVYQAGRTRIGSAGR